MKIRTKLWIAIAIAVAIALFVGIVLTVTFGQVHENIERSRQTDRIVRSVFELKLVTVDYQTSGLDRTRAQWRAKYDTLLRELDGLVTATSEQRFMVERMKQSHAALKRTFEALNEVAEDGQSTEENGAAVAMGRRLTAKMDVGLLTMISDANQLLESIYKELVEGQKRATAVVALSSITMVALIFGLAVMVTRTAIRPLLRLGRATAIIGQGDLEHRTGMTASDEVGQLSRSFDTMLDRLNTVMASRDSLNREVVQRKYAERTLRKTLTNLEQSNRDLEQFAYSASHDLQEPLRKVMAFGSLLEAEYGAKLEGDGHLYLASMQNATRRMQTLINDLLSYSRVTTRGKAFEPVDMNEIVRGVLSDLETRVRETAAVVEVGDLSTLEADPTQMRQLLQNLIGNALKFHKPDEAPCVKVSAETTGSPAQGEAGAPPRNYRLVVEDNGIGFDEKYLDRIFGVFQRLHRREEYSGSGIGLAVCRRIAERHSGTITATSKPGEGARFVVTVPVKHTDEGRHNP